MPHAPDLTGRALEGRYELHAVIGEGAFGRVYRGFDRRLARQVAVKVIKPWWAEEREWVERFQREAQLLASVEDPGIVQIFDIGEAGEGPYYVAELVLGESLAQRLERGPLPVAQARSIALGLCDALGSAHRQGVVHCDVKPANVLLGEGGRVKVGDFGVARLAEGTSQGPSATVAGTPRYMSPEQARGRPPTAATDVYSTGVVLYEMLAGEPPFVHGSVVELGLRHLQEQPAPLPARVPITLREIVRTALAKDPGERYRDGGAMAAALRTGELPKASVRVRPARPRRAPQSESTGTLATVALLEPATIALSEREQQATLARRVSAGRELPVRPVVAPGPARRRPLGLLAGALALAGGGLALALLLGASAHTTVPKLRGLARAGVQARARRLHVVPAFSRRYSHASTGTAIAQRPAAGTRVTDGSTVHVVMSAGPPPVRVPAVVGEPSAQAEQALAAAGLRYGVSSVPAPASRAGFVVRQTPRSALTVPHGSTVALSVAEVPRWRPLTTFSGVDDGHSVPFRILGKRWRVTYNMSYEGPCLLLVVCFGPSAQARNLNTGASFGGFELGEGELETHAFDSGPGLYRIEVSGGRDSAQWSMTVEDYY
jgi:eukaryotic-like serine/threonine-protein kinase